MTTACCQTHVVYKLDFLYIKKKSKDYSNENRKGFYKLAGCWLNRARELLLAGVNKLIN